MATNETIATITVKITINNVFITACNKISGLG
jgi:hypothetical protein